MPPSLQSITPSIAICIPTHGRLDLVKEALASALNQTHPPSEVLVSDDCGDPKVRALVEKAAPGLPFPLRYLHCTEGPGQAENVNHALRAVCSDLLLLLHDDDLLLPRCLEILVEPFLREPGLLASYGNQVVVDSQGEELPVLSEALNHNHHRTSDRVGIQECSFCAGILGQFPNNAYLIRSEVAKTVGYDLMKGAAMDRDFGIRCAEHGTYYYTGKPTAKYRLSVDSIVRGAGEINDNSAFMFARLLEDLHPADPKCKAMVDYCYEEILPAAIAQAARLARIRAGWAWYLSPAHAKRIFTLGGLRRAGMLLRATINQ